MSCSTARSRSAPSCRTRTSWRIASPGCRTLAIGAKLPNENELAERFSVSRATVREAVLGLLEAGYLSRRHGSGTYVTAAPRSRHALDSPVSYTAMIREAGHEPGETLLNAGRRGPDEVERGLLGLEN